MLNSLILMVMLTANGMPADVSSDMRYDLPVGMSYTYRVTTDHFPFAGKGLRLHAKLVLEIVGRDGEDFTHCRVRLLSDTVYDKDQDVTYVQLGNFDFAGHRLFASGGYMNTAFDSRGRLDTDDPAKEKDKNEHQVSTQFVNINSVQAAVSGNSPFMMQLLIPALPNAESIEVQREYVDTITIPSKSIHVPTSYGVGSKVEQHTLYDTLHRSFVLDSVHSDDKSYIGYITIKTNRYNLVGTQFRTEAKLVRDMNNGLVSSFDEKCYKVTDRKDRLWYISRATLIEKGPIKNSTDVSNPGAGSVYSR